MHRSYAAAAASQCLSSSRATARLKCSSASSGKCSNARSKTDSASSHRVSASQRRTPRLVYELSREPVRVSLLCADDIGACELISEGEPLISLLLSALQIARYRVKERDIALDGRHLEIVQMLSREGVPLS